jgi:hypothetical protein
MVSIRPLRRKGKNAVQHSEAKCAAYQYGKHRRQAKPGQVSEAIKEAEGSLSLEQLNPGQRISIDYFQCSTRRKKVLWVRQTENNKVIRQFLRGLLVH